MPRYMLQRTFTDGLAAKENSLPVDTITEVSVLDPYFYY